LAVGSSGVEEGQDVGVVEARRGLDLDKSLGGIDLL